MRKPQSIPSDGNRRRLVTEPFTVCWRYDGVPHRITIKPWGHSYEPSIPKLWPPLNGIMMLVGAVAVYWDLTWLMVPVALWVLLMTPAAVMGVLAPREALSPVSAVHDYLYRKEGKVQYDILVDGHWQPRSRMGRARADAVMFADEDDPLWLQWCAYYYTRLVGWWPWEGWDEWVMDRIPFA